jgi:protein SCO1/2
MKIVSILVLHVFVSCSSQSIYSSHNVTGAHLVGGDYVTKDFNGNVVTEKSYPGKYKLLFFGFTSCQSVCPLGLSTMGKALHKLPEKMMKSIQPLFVTVDPDRDSNTVLKKYLPSFDKRLIGLRGTELQVNHMIKKFRGYYGRVEESNDDYSFDHSDLIYLIDKNGKYLSHFSSSTGNEYIAKQIKKIINSIK